MSSAQTVNSSSICSSVAPRVVRPSCLWPWGQPVPVMVWGLGSEGLGARRYGGLGAWGLGGLRVWGSGGLRVWGPEGLGGPRAHRYGGLGAWGSGDLRVSGSQALQVWGLGAWGCGGLGSGV